MTVIARNQLLAILALAALAAAFPAAAATPPALVNYQGVLRNAQDLPQNGTFDMTFRFFDAQSAGNEILVDAHTGGGGNPVTVTDGLFTVQLGGGTLSDGAGPGSYTALDQVFLDYGAVWLETKVGSETLSPRLRVMSSPYALNAESLGGLAPGNYVDTTSSAQVKAGALTCNGGIEGDNVSGFGVQGIGGAAGGFFASQAGTSYAYVGSANFEHYAIKAVGSDAGGFFRDANNTGQAYAGYGDTGIWASGSNVGGYFSSAGHSGQTYVGWNDFGIYGYGDLAGGRFMNNLYITRADLADYYYGIDADGTYCAPFCGAGGHFTNNPYTGVAFTAIGDTGVYATGSYQGGEFFCDNKSGHAQTAYGDFGVVGYGTPASGLNGGGGYFADTLTGSDVYTGQGGYGIFGRGTGSGGHFEQSGGASYADLGAGATGVIGLGNSMGGHFEHFPQYVYANVAYASGSNLYTILGNGMKSFVQNDPLDPDKVVVFAALEGDEAGTYTRGTGRLVDGTARVPLSASFALVTNPDIGLTAHVTPRGQAVPLTVSSLTSDALEVRGPAGSDAAFDFIVFGLRLGFEQHPPIQPRVVDSPLPAIPTEAETAALLGNQDTPLGRFASMRRANGETQPLDFSRSAAMKLAAGAGRMVVPQPDPASLRHAPAAPAGSTSPAGVVVLAPGEAALAASPGMPTPPPGPKQFAQDVSQPPIARQPPTGMPMKPAPANPASAMPVAPPPSRPVTPPAAAPPAAPPTPPVDAAPQATSPAAIAETVQAGDLLALDPAVSTDHLVLAKGNPTETVVGIVAGDPGATYEETAPLALSGSIVSCRVDATRGAIRPGDLLVASETAGRARRADAPLPGSVVGRALEPLAGGTGTIRVLARPQ